MPDENQITTGAEVAALIAQMAQQGRLPAALAAHIDEHGIFHGIDPNTGEEVEVHPALIRELRPYIAQVAPDYAATYFRPLPEPPPGAGLPWYPQTVYYEPPPYYTSGIPAAALTPRATPGVARIPSASTTPTLRRTTAALAAHAAGARVERGWRLLGDAAPRTIAPIPAPTGEPVSSIILGAVGVLWSLFRGSGTRELAESLNSLRQTVTAVADSLLRFAWTIARAVGAVLRAVHTLWVKVLWPIVRQIPRLVRRVRDLIHRDLPRVLATIERLRRWLIEMYERFWRPLIIMTQRLRKMLLILRLFRLRWAERLDARLRQIQGRIMEPLAIALVHIGWIEQWINVILDAEHRIQEAVWGRSLWSYQGHVFNTWAHYIRDPMPDAERMAWNGGPAAVSPETSRSEVRALLRYDVGPLAAPVRAMRSQIRTELGLV
jgi:hypothetical protein